jgi:hypothetical protein
MLGKPPLSRAAGKLLILAGEIIALAFKALVCLGYVWAKPELS